MLFKKGGTGLIAVFTIVIASLLVGMTFIMSDSAFAGDGEAAVNGRPVLNPFFANNEDLDRFFFERDVMGVIEGGFEDNPLFQKGTQNALARPDDFRADRDN